MRDETKLNNQRCISELKMKYSQGEKPIVSFNTDATDALWRVIRKLSDDNTMQVVYALDEKKALTSGELHKETNLSGSDLNHILFDLKNLNVIIQNREDKKYHLTSYGEVILRVLWDLLGTLSRLNK